MTIPQRRAHLKKLIDAVSDPAVLDQVAKVLEKPSKRSARTSPLVKRALKAEADLAAGRFQTLDAFNKEMDAFVEELYTKKAGSKRGR